MALLYRSNAQSRVLEHALVSAGLSYRVYGGLRFFERQEIKHALAYLRLMENTDDDNALLRIINYPTRGIGARSIEQLQEAAKINGTTLWDAAARAGGKVSGFVGLVESMRSATSGLTLYPHGVGRGVPGTFGSTLPLHPQGVGRGVPGTSGSTLPLPEIIDYVLVHSGLIAHYEAEKNSPAKRREAEERLENLQELVTAATLFVHENEDDSLTSFLTHASLEAGEHQAGDQDDALHLMTVHAAKGLEFNAVFITGLEEGLFPHQNSINADDIDEERRLMYVAITRARRRLYLTFAQSRMLHGKVNYGMASCFLRELPENLTQWLSPRLTQRNPFSAFGYATPSTAVQRSVSGAVWQAGQRVMHQKFGEGVVTATEGGGNDGRVQVNFKHAGSKWLSLEYAKLTAL
jgi:DNA helicase-2/ATP-dependent DNA helicase PcrA